MIRPLLFALVASVVASAAPARAVDLVVGTYPFEFSGGGAIVFTTLPVTVGLSPDFYEDGPSFATTVPASDVPQSVVLDATNPEFAGFVAALTNGEADVFTMAVSGSSRGTDEFELFGNADLAGKDVARIVLYFTEVVVSSPGTDPNNNGNWTDYVARGEVRFVVSFAELTAVAPVEAGPICAHGGRIVTSGVDMNSNELLDAEEVTATAYACDAQDGTDGRPVLLSSTPIEAGAVCAAGGTRVAAGYDTDGNGVLDDVEIASDAVVCNGAPGEPGAQGQQGEQGGSCTVTKNDDGLTVTCPDGSKETVPAGGCASTAVSFLALLPLVAIARRRRA